MSSSKRFRKKSIGIAVVCTAGCALASHQMPLARSVLLPIPTITLTPHSDVFQIASPPPSQIATESAGNDIPNIFATSSTSPMPLETALPTSSYSPTATPQTLIPSSTPNPTIPPTAWVDDSIKTEVRITEREAPQAPFMEEAHLLSLEAIGTYGGASPVFVRISPSTPPTLDTYLFRKKSHGSSDYTGPANVDVSAGRASFVAKELGEYLLAGNETYFPPSDVDISIDRPVSESVDFESNTQEVSSSALQALGRRRIMSVSPNLHVRNYLQEKQYRLRPLILYFHGMGERYPKKSWENITSYLKNSAANREQLKGTIFSILQYDSLQAVHVSKERIKAVLLQTTGSVPILVVCHSMGCLEARDFMADPDMKDLFIGGIMLGAANGSPWVPKKRMRPSMTGQPDATALLTAQTAALAKVLPNMMESYFSSKSLSELVSMFDEGMTSKGALSLATARDDIPTATYQLRFNIGIYPMRFSETLTPDDVFTLPCSDKYFPQTPRTTRIRYGKCYANFARELRQWERQQGLDTVPRWYAYAGYFRGNELRSARETFLKRFVSMEAARRFFTDTTGPMDEEALKFAASLLSDRVTKDGIPKRITDGLVDYEDACLLNDGPSIESASSKKDNLIIDQFIVRQRLPGDIIAVRSFLRSHRQIVRGLSSKDSELFESIAQDMGTLLNTYYSQSETYADADLNGIHDEIEKPYHDVQNVYDSRGIAVIKTTTVQFRQPIPCSGEKFCFDLPYDVVRITDDQRANKQTIDILKSESRRAYRIWRAWRLFDN